MTALVERRLAAMAAEIACLLVLTQSPHRQGEGADEENLGGGPGSICKPVIFSRAVHALRSLLSGLRALGCVGGGVCLARPKRHHAPPKLQSALHHISAMFSHGEVGGRKQYP